MSSIKRFALAFAFSYLNFGFLYLSALLVGGLEEWSLVRFAGLYGIIEAATGLANIVAPNFWALPVAEFHARSETTVLVSFADLRRVHIDGLGRVFGGGAFIVWALLSDGTDAMSALHLPLLAGLGLTIVFLSALVSRWGIARPDLDIVQFKVYWRQREKTIPPISLGTSFLQFFLTLISLPIATVSAPGFLFHPEFYPAPGLVAAALVAALVSGALFYMGWASHIRVRETEAPPQAERALEPPRMP